ncbi:MULTISPECIES: LexA family transcriptional regulator [Polaribacter]|uniref:LexA family transcriptional regulator n=1 Tax=Polaribacter sejongensis TaxID=985043 RepID=A0AAJ1VKP4_9FLAO|nr:MULTISPECIES: LexA family transcriptional regulator [Polaribacter]AUC23914.1 XRE family transcriptional regulator [Polaribacter sejongensis]MDN3621387.1 LexA family transcriptional regulator [Polaribacter undariae]UWD31911.1 LexA family transcriptional regulator [Polaribacter undariae]
MCNLSKNIKHLRGLKGLTQESLAEELSVTRSRISSYEEGRSSPSIDFLIDFSNYFKLPIDIIVRNDLTKAKDVSFIEVGNKRVLFPISIDAENENLIEVVSAKASAGYLLGYDDPEYIEQLQKIKLPFLPTGKHRAFPIKGNSMLPMKDGSYVVAEFVEDIKEAKSGLSYIVVTKDDGMTYKRLENRVEERQSFLLKPDNPSYQPYEVPVSEILELWKFTCSINTQEYEEHELKLSSIIQMFNGLGVELEALKKSLI